VYIYIYIISYHIIYTLWLFNIAMGNGPFTDDFPIKTSIYKGFSMAMLVITKWCIYISYNIIPYIHAHKRWEGQSPHLVMKLSRHSTGRLVGLYTLRKAKVAGKSTIYISMYNIYIYIYILFTYIRIIIVIIIYYISYYIYIYIYYIILYTVIHLWFSKQTKPPLSSAIFEPMFD